MEILGERENNRKRNRSSRMVLRTEGWTLVHGQEVWKHTKTKESDGVDV